MHSIENLEPDEDETWPPALFLVQRNKEGFVVFLNELEQELEELDLDEVEEEVSPTTRIFTHIVPGIIKKNSGKYFALVFPGNHQTIDDNVEEALILVLGDINNTDMYMAEVDRDEDQPTLEPWERLNVLNFPELVVPLRRSITLQG